MGFHVPVMAREAVAHLVVDPAATYIDATAGGGGHSAAIAAALRASGRLLAIDRDAAAVAASRARLAPFGDRVQVVNADYAAMAACCRRCGIQSVRGVLFDLGVSSHQIDTPARGFSHRASGPLDMRMDERQPETAAAWLARASVEAIARALRDYGEERAARRVARAIVARRQRGELRTTADLRAAVMACRPTAPNKTLARVFQAIRIVVNAELAQLERGLEEAAALLEPGGRLVVLTYQSGEDRVVKRKMEGLVRGCICPPRAPVCTCGRLPTFRRAVRRPLRAAAAEIAANPRARSARLRVYEKLGEEAAR